MFNTALSKLLPQTKYQPQVSNTSQMDTFLNEFNSAMSKNIGSSFGKIIMQKYGRKIGRRQSQQLNYKISKSSNLINSVHRSSIEEERIQQFRPNFTIYDATRNKKMKRHTYNYRFSSSREQKTDNTANKKDNSTRHKRSLITTQNFKTQQNTKQVCIQKSLFEDNKETHIYQGQFLKPKEIVKKFSIQNKLMPINFNADIYQKPSLVQLIKKYKFENLKTNNLPSTPQQTLKEDKNSQVFIHKKFSPKKQGKFYKKTSNNNNNYKIFKKEQARRQKKEAQSDTKYLLKKMNSMLSPWGTIADQHSVIQSSVA